MSDYIAIIHKDGESDFGVSFPDFPGCVTAGRTLDEARAMAGEALGLHLEGMLLEAAALPSPSSLESVMTDRGNRDGVAILVAAPRRAPRSVRVNVTIAADELAEIDAYAARHGLTRSGFLAAAARRKLDESA
ncbi:type II toxin-antitoxin system HicB family antitoxin [Aurantimonas sp. A2-1-M11]|uniref:type II toxin-antitoxin system HicB family antitoxin n=1 Tax=Aurantimonas sp. A2-1-M11 TaxID=3113712 RepID=UPI002F932D8C